MPGLIWMHPPRDLTAQQVPEDEVTMRQALGWMHADPPAAAAEDDSENDEHHTESVDSNPDHLGHHQELGSKPGTRAKRKRG
jgi:hypothetical protein